MHLYIKSTQLNEGTVLSQPTFYCKTCTHLVSKERKSLKCYGYYSNLCFPFRHKYTHVYPLIYMYTQFSKLFQGQHTAAVISLYHWVKSKDFDVRTCV